MFLDILWKKKVLVLDLLHGSLECTQCWAADGSEMMPLLVNVYIVVFLFLLSSFNERYAWM